MRYCALFDAFRDWAASAVLGVTPNNGKLLVPIRDTASYGDPLLPIRGEIDLDQKLIARNPDNNCLTESTHVLRRVPVMKAADVMVSNVITAGVNASIGEVVVILLNNHISAAPVVDEKVSSSAS